MRNLLIAVIVGVALTRHAALLVLGARRDDRAEGAMWREFGLRNALSHMPADSPGRAVVEALLARGTLTAEEGRRFKARGLRAALANMPAESPGRAVVEALLARETHGQPGRLDEDEEVETEIRHAPTGRIDFLEQLERLVALRERGDLTAQEFEAAKRKLLS